MCKRISVVLGLSGVVHVFNAAEIHVSFWLDSFVACCNLSCYYLAAVLRCTPVAHDAAADTI